MGRRRFIWMTAAACGLVVLLGLAGCASAAGSGSGTSSASASSAGASSASASGMAGSAASSAVEAGGDITDQMTTESATGVELRVFQLDGALCTVPDCYPISAPTAAAFEDGRFYTLVADVDFLNGGVAGYVDYPEVRSVQSVEETTPFEMGLPSIRETPYGVVLIGDYADGDVLANDQGVRAVWKDGAWVFRYDKSLKLPDGAQVLVRTGVSAEDVQAGAATGVLSCADYFVLPSAAHAG